MKKKIFYSLASAFVVLSLTACGNSEDEDQNKEIQANSIKDQTEEQAVEVIPEVTADEKNKNVPNNADVIKEFMPSLSDEQIELSDESYNFIKENSDLFPAKTEEAISKVKKQSQLIDLRLLNKNVKPYFTTITSYEGFVVQIEEENYENGEIYSAVNVGDTNGNNHTFIMFKSTGDILEEDHVRFWGAPVGSYSYETLDGGYQNAQIFFGSHIEKVQ